MRGFAAVLALRWRMLTGAASAAAVALGVLACLCTTLAVVGPRAAAELRTSAFRQFVAAAPASAKTILASTADGSLSSPAGLSVSQIQRSAAQLRRNLRGLPQRPAAADWASLTTPLLATTDNAPTLRAALPSKVELSYRPALASYVRVVAGRLPGSQPSTGQPAGSVTAGSVTASLQAAVTRTTARRFGLAVGSRLALPGAGLVLTVTAIVQPRDPAALFWTADPAVSTPQLVYVGHYDYWIGAAFIPPDAVPTLLNHVNLAAAQVTWTFPLDLATLTATQATQLQQRLAGALSTAGRFDIAAIPVSRARSPARGPGSPSDRGQVRAFPKQPTRVLIPLSVAVSTGTEALIAGFESEATSVASVLDLLAVSLAVLATVVVVLAGWLLTERRRKEFALLRARSAARRQLAIAILGGSAATVLPGAAAGAAIAVALTPSAPAALSWWLAGLAVLAALAGPVLVTIRVHRGYAPVLRPDRPTARAPAFRRPVIESGLLLGAVGGLLALRNEGSGTGSDVYTSAAPILLAVGVAVVVVRMYPLLVRVVLRARGKRAGPSAFLGLVRAARVSTTATLPAFALVLALALVSFAGLVRGAVLRGELAASWQQAGADAVVTGPGPVTAVLRRSVAVISGAQHVAAAGVGPVTVLLNAVQLVTVRVVGQAAGMSAVFATAGYLVLPRQSVPRLHVATDTLLVTGPSVNQPALRAAVARDDAGARIVLRSRLLAGLQAAPLRRGAYLALELGAIAAACCGLLVLLLSLLLSASARRQTLARMSTMGLSTAQARLAAIIELLPQLLGALAGGLACAVALVPALGPALRLAVITGSAGSVPVRIEPAWLIVAALALLVLAIVTLTGQTTLSDRNAARSLRFDE